MMSKKRKPTKSGSETMLPPEDLTATDWAILKHVSLYHFTIRQAAQTLFFDSDGSKAGTALDALARHGYLKNRDDSKPSPAQASKSKKRRPKESTSSKSKRPQVLKVGGVKYYLLGNSSSLLASLGFRFPKERFVPPKTEQSFYKHIAALWYCLFDGPRRYRLDTDEMTKLWTNVIPESKKVPHQPAYCLSEEEQGPVVVRLYPTRKPKAAQIVEEVRKKLENDANNLKLKQWIEAGDYGYAILVPSHNRIRDVERELVKSRQQHPVLAMSRVTVHFAPPPPLLAKALRDRGDDEGPGMTAKLPPPATPPSDHNDSSSIDTPPDKEPPDDEALGFEFYSNLL